MESQEAHQELGLSERVCRIATSTVAPLIVPARDSRAGTSMISLIIPPKVPRYRPYRFRISHLARYPLSRIQDQISRASAMLTQEYGTASNIKSRVNRLSVLAAITSTQQRLKLYNRVPPNGLVLFVGTVLTDEGKEKKVSFDFEPHKPINTCVYSYVRSCLMTLHTHRLSHLSSTQVSLSL